MSAVRRILEDDFDRKCYSFSMGHINPAKLANFPEIEVYVLLSSSLTSCFDSKFAKNKEKINFIKSFCLIHSEFHVPVISLHELAIALDIQDYEGFSDFTLNFSHITSQEKEDGQNNKNGDENDSIFSTVTGSFVTKPSSSKVNSSTSSQELSIFSTPSIEFFQQREFQGLDPTASLEVSEINNEEDEESNQVSNGEVVIIQGDIGMASKYNKEINN